MFTHPYKYLAGALLLLPLGLMQCGDDDIGGLSDDDVTEPRDGGPSQANLALLGKYVFFDKISIPKRMACATCHDAAVGWTLNKEQINLHQVAVTGADPHTAGSIKPPSNAYARNMPLVTQGCNIFGLPCGGVFWDGRAEGTEKASFAGATAHIGSEVFAGDADLQKLYEKFLGPIADQALNPFPNKVEQNIEAQQVCEHVAGAQYAPLFQMAWGKAIDCSTAAAVELSFKRIAVALAAWQSSDEVNPFSSKRDKALAADIKAKGSDVSFPLSGLTDQENLGHELFYGKANCALCHTNKPAFGVVPSKAGLDPGELYTDAAYHNIGVPRNHETPDPSASAGLGARTGLAQNLGMHKTPTLRNVDKRTVPGFVKAYTHNGWFKSLEGLVHFYNTSDVSENGETAKKFGVTRCDTTKKKDWTMKEALAANCWPAPQEKGTLAIGPLIGDLDLSLEEEAAIVAYLKTLTDTTTPKPPKPFK